MKSQEQKKIIRFEIRRQMKNVIKLEMKKVLSRRSLNCHRAYFRLIFINVITSKRKSFGKGIFKTSILNDLINGLIKLNYDSIYSNYYYYDKLIDFL